jgi:hypothetical protein
MPKKQPTKSTPTRRSIRKKKRHEEGRKNGNCHTNEKKGELFKVHPLLFSFSAL